ncbi:MAG TPA: glycosyltransferase family 4 protein, partial [Polyangiaceae bacterium]|nr:glycosyltransferase family 4 protein [Polyangiaceae bacterium]
MSGRPIAYVMEQTLGSVTHYLNLRREEAAFGGPGPRWIPVEFRGGLLPWTLTGSWMARRALDRVLSEVDGIFMHTTTIAPLCVNHFQKKPAIVSTDATPWNRRGMREAYGLRQEGPLYSRAKRELLRNALRAAAGLVGWSEWAKASFVEDYGCSEQDVVVIPPGVDLTRFAPGNRNRGLPRILFVGGDFARKGGHVLLDVFRRRLRGRAQLVLVTHASVASEPGIEVHRNVQANSPELQALYATSDLFVLPTLADCYSIVAMEALAAGLPVVVTRVG